MDTVSYACSKAVWTDITTLTVSRLDSLLKTEMETTNNKAFVLKHFSHRLSFNTTIKTSLIG